MTKQKFTHPVSLFYSYCHKDKQYKESVEKHLVLLQRDGFINGWSDQSILPGQKISEEVRKKIDNADIVVFLISQDFIASGECMKEWNHAKQLIDERERLHRIPVILKNCAWQDLLSKDDIKSLPEDGKPVDQFSDSAEAWQQVYAGIKLVVDKLRRTFTPKGEFLEKMEKSDFLSQTHLKLQDIYTFLPLTYYAPHQKDNASTYYASDQKGNTSTYDASHQKISTSLEEKILDEKSLLEKKYVLIHGEDMSGKTALGRHLFLSLAKQSKQVMHIDLKEISGKLDEKIFRKAYQDQFHGDYSLWKRKTNRTLILDNLSSTPSSLADFVAFSKKNFDRVLVTLSSDIYMSFFMDDERLADFSEVKINPLTHSQQEQLIKKRMKLSDQPVTDSLIDQMEKQVNSVIINNRIVPRYPFYVLSILQTCEGYMPSSLAITSQGHCYYVLILANLIKAGISKEDSEINTCLNFAENFAFSIYKHKRIRNKNALDFNNFIREYRQNFIIPESTLNRLQHPDYGIITREGDFKAPYMYYFFLGRFLSKNRDKHLDIVEKMCSESHLSSNYLTLIFVIHHTTENQIVEDILIRTMCTLDNIPPALLSPDETKRFGDLVSALPKTILSEGSVESRREKEREARDARDRRDVSDDDPEADSVDIVNDFYRILKNNKILGQILRNKYGSLEKTVVADIIETVADSGLRLVKFFFIDDEIVTSFAHYLHAKRPKDDIQKIKRALRFLCFLSTMNTIESIVSNINSPEIMDLVADVVEKKSTPAYDLIGYFSNLDSSKELTEKMKDDLKKLLKKHDDLFLKRVLSIRTQHYMNTHRSKTKTEQSICSLLKIKYIPRLKPPKLT